MEDSGVRQRAHRLAAAACGAARRGGPSAWPLAPMYAKSHSYGEYVFDHGWADALERAGGDYYPKLQVCRAVQPGAGATAAASIRTPAMPVGGAGQRRWSRPAASSTCPRCTSPSAPRRNGRHSARPAGCSGSACSSTGRTQGYASFDDFLGALSSRKRKVHAAGAARCARPPADVPMTLRGARDHARRTGTPSTASIARPPTKWGRSAYLSRSFCSLLGERLGDRVVLMVAEKAGKPVAGALNLAGQRGAVRPQLGLPRRLRRSCISSSATTAPSTSRSSTGCSASRPARRASTRSSAATCRRRPTRRTGSRIPACAARWTTSWRASGRRCCGRWRRWRS